MYPILRGVTGGLLTVMGAMLPNPLWCFAYPLVGKFVGNLYWGKGVES